MNKDKKNVVVLGGNYAGVNTCHYLIRHVFPHLPHKTDYRVVLVNPSSEAYHNSAAPRLMVSAELLPESNVFSGLDESFKQYGDESFRFVLGKATAVDESRRMVKVDTASGPTEISFQALIIATGASSAEAVLSSGGPHDGDIHGALKEMRERIKTAKAIVIGGGGPAGVEVAGEIGEHINGKPGWLTSPSPKVSIKIITGANQLLPVLRPALGAQAEGTLKKLGVQVIYKTRIERTEKGPDGKTIVQLSNGDKLEADIYINATGTTPATAFLPPDWIDERRKVKTNATTLRVDVAGPRIYAIGDVGSHTRGGVMDILSAVPVLGTNLRTDLLEAEGVKPQYADREFKGDVSETQFVTLGQSSGVGAFQGFKVPNVMVWAVKSRSYMCSMVKAQHDGSHWKKESTWKAKPIAQG